jgi:hypothetical protein
MADSRSLCRCAMFGGVDGWDCRCRRLAYVRCGSLMR